MNTKQGDLQEYTRLPLKSINIAGQHLPTVIVSTPHSGDITIELKESKGGGVFGGNSEHSKSFGQILNEIQDIEIEAINYLLDNWKKGNLIITK